ncbi:amidohydrolase [Flavimarina sp. Hel_I_48]|uniref:amidohydrolase n=1 Tax=Flavimarina sp. Hel_I_48 TaxID=1392488 RepID=UPI0004DF22C9|nr:amidohydrolase [Flavimarina sp. Hel_I_48]
MQKTLKIAGLQADLAWHDPKSNTAHFNKIIEGLDEDLDLIVLPEMFATGFSMQPENIADSGDTLQWMKKQALQTKSAIAGSLMVVDDGTYYNRFYFVTPEGTVDHYDKRHRFTLAGEHEVYARGKTPKIVTYKGWKIALQVCYDLRFPVFSRNTQDYDVLLYVANWPKTRVFAWDTLLKARAIENMSYCVGINRVGTDDNNNEYDGHSGIYDCLGATLAFAEKRETTVTATLTKEHLQETRHKLNFLADRDSFHLLD